MVAVVGVLLQLGRREDPLSLLPLQGLWPILFCLSTEHLKPYSSHKTWFAFTIKVIIVGDFNIHVNVDNKITTVSTL